MIQRLICWARGHTWDIVAVNVRMNHNLCHLHPLAGCKAVCSRCDALWSDLVSPFFASEPIVFPSRLPRELPRAVVVR